MPATINDIFVALPLLSQKELRELKTRLDPLVAELRADDNDVGLAYGFFVQSMRARGFTIMSGGVAEKQLWWGKFRIATKSLVDFVDANLGTVRKPVRAAAMQVVVESCVRRMVLRLNWVKASSPYKVMMYIMEEPWIGIESDYPGYLALNDFGRIVDMKGK